MNQAGAARLLAVVVLVAQAAQPGRAPDLARIRRVRHDERVAAADVAKDSGMVCTRTRPGPAPGAAPCGRPGPRRARSARWAVSSRATRSRWWRWNQPAARRLRGPGRGIRWGGPLPRLDFHGEEFGRRDQQPRVL